MKRSDKLSVGVLGLWHLGLVVSVCLARSGYKVFGFDQDENNINKLNSGKLPIYEPKLLGYFKKYFNKNLFISSKPKDAIKNKDYIFIALDTPVNENDEIDLTSLNKLFDSVVKYSTRKSTIIISSQVPVGTTRSLIGRLKSKTKVIYFPENLRLGHAISDFLKPSRIVLGTDESNTVEVFLRDFPIFGGGVLRMSIESAEMLKHALNSYLALNVSFSSELCDLCELLGANAKDVILGLKSDPRISPKAPIDPGLGFAGGTLGREIKTLINLSSKYSYPAKLVKAIYSVNKDRLDYLLKKIKKIHPVLSGKKIGLLGLTYKPNTDTLRRSQSLEFAQMLINKKVKVRTYDPVIKNLNLKYIDLRTSIEDFLKDLDMLILMTEWPQFQLIDPELVSNLMRQKVIIDTKNFLDKQKYQDLGFIYIGIGQSA